MTGRAGRDGGEGCCIDSCVADGSVSDSESKRAKMRAQGLGVSLNHRLTHKCRRIYTRTLESFAELFKNDEVAHYLQKAGMSLAKA